MSEAEVLQSMFASIQAVMTLFSIFFGVTSAYIAGLFFFLSRAGMPLRLLAFSLLSIGLAFLGGSALMIQRMQDGLFTAWARLPAPMLNVDAVRNPLPVQLPLGWSLLEVGVGIGWITALSVYLVLGYLTFLYRWRHSQTQAREMA